MLWHERRSVYWSHRKLTFVLVAAIVEVAPTVVAHRQPSRLISFRRIRWFHIRRRRLCKLAQAVQSETHYLETGRRTVDDDVKLCGCTEVILWAAKEPWDDFRTQVMRKCCVDQLIHLHNVNAHTAYAGNFDVGDEVALHLSSRARLARVADVLKLPLVVAVVGAIVTAILRLFF